ncbi:hypothetical protein ACFO1B_08035 [Dactylosporangium siamense]|uniref:Uncharacterized protein n=1 Tax=Dactylosporangium siamense TaxID=685454 RepID=A0A919PQ80_9ACTN|nr:hypothetical protein [Dactylosporangium siamense]GIG48064.1 hypothetical protein Dsi01nite_061050 [Dactylosporangium siamense]
MARDRTAEELRRLGERRMNTAIISVAVVYGVVAVSAVVATVALAVYVIRTVFF